MVGETITKEEAIKREPILEHLPRIDNLKFTLTPERKVYSPHRFAQFLADYLERNGVRIQYNSKVLFFERDYDRLLSIQTGNSLHPTAIFQVCYFFFHDFQKFYSFQRKSFGKIELLKVKW